MEIILPEFNIFPTKTMHSIQYKFFLKDMKRESKNKIIIILNNFKY